MANRKEDEKNERIIRGLLKLPENRRCINCNSLGPQYVCINFWTFVCTTCSGIHREFTHRVKSVSMAKFTSQEVAALQGGGNMRAKESLFKDFDPQRHSFPDNNSNVERLRDFIRHAYVDRRYGGGRGSEMPPKGEESYGSRKSDSSRSGSRSPPYEDAYERRYSDRPSSGGRSDDGSSRHDERSPGYDRESQQFGDYRRSPVRPEVVNDWRKEDRFGNGKKFEDRRGSDDDSRSEGRSPDHQKDKGAMSPPIVRPVRDILGDNVVPLRIIVEPPKANGTRIPDAVANTRRTASSSSLGSSDGNQADTKRETLASLIDFDADPEPPTKTAVQEPQLTFMAQPAAPPTSTSGDTNWACFDLATEVSHFPSKANNFDSVLSQLSAPAPVPVQSSGTLPLGNSSLPPSSGHSMGGPASHPSMLTFNSGVPAVPSDSNPSLIPSNGQWPPNQQPSLFPTNGIQPSVQPFPSKVASTTQTWNPSFANNTHGLSRPKAPQDPPMEVKSSGRTALPEDLFAPTYPSFSVPAQGWNYGPPGGMQYNTPVHIPSYQQPSKMSNPFDLNTDQNPPQASSFPSMTSLHGTLPNMHTSGHGLPFPAWTQNQLPHYPSALPPQAPSGASALPSRGYMGQQVPNNMPPSWHQGGGFGNQRPAFNSMNSNQHMAGGYAAPANPASFPSAGGNPFG